MFIDLLTTFGWVNILDNLTTHLDAGAFDYKRIYIQSVGSNAHYTQYGGGIASTKTVE